MKLLKACNSWVCFRNYELFEKISLFLKSLSVASLQQRATEITNFLKDFRNWFFLWELDMFSVKKSFFKKKTLKLANLQRNAAETTNFLRAFITFFWKKGFFETNFWVFLEPLKFKRRIFAIESHWVSKNSWNVQSLVSSWEIGAFFSTNSCFYSNTPKSRRFAAECDWDKKISRSFDYLCFRLKKLDFSKQCIRTFWNG